MQVFFESIKGILPSFKEEYIGIPFRDAGIDSIDLVTIRVEFENILGSRIGDRDWLDFENINEIIEYCKRHIDDKKENKRQLTEGAVKRSVVINMPQMALAALSENWLFKEIGGIHWDSICEGLNESSFNLRDELNNRLYATFVRIRIRFSDNLMAFKESEILEINGEMKRFGESMYFSNLKLASKKHSIVAELMTTFSIRNSTDNTKLAKSQPSGDYNTVEQFSALPEFGNEYRLLKKGELKELKYQDFDFTIKDSSIFEYEYTLNPYYDLNGVNLLYFAAYPIINDNCEAKYFNNSLELDGRWEQEYYTTYKDVFYFSNCNIDETIIYRLIDFHTLDDGSIQIQSVLLRKSDLIIMAKIFTVKSKTN